MILRAQSLGKRFGARRLFRDLSFEVGSAELCVVTGPNGSGKSTLMRILTGLLPADEGSFEFREGDTPIGMAERGRFMGFVAPDLILYPELTARENITFFSQLRGFPVTRKECENWLTRVGLTGRGEDLVRTFSTGMRQRLKFVYALIHDPPVLLLDEPTSNLDAAGIALVHSLIAERRGRGPILCASNEQREIDLGDRVLRLG